LEIRIVNSQYYPSKFLLVLLVLGGSLGIHAQEQPRKPVVKEHKNIAVPIWKYLNSQGKPSSSAREGASPQPIPPTIPPTTWEKIPPKKIGDLNCPAVDQAKMRVMLRVQPIPVRPAPCYVLIEKMTKGNVFCGSNVLPLAMRSQDKSKRLQVADSGAE
jgi:hypothetical protein